MLSITYYTIFFADHQVFMSHLDMILSDFNVLSQREYNADGTVFRFSPLMERIADVRVIAGSSANEPQYKQLIIPI